MNCLVCGGRVSSFSGVKLKNGKVCKECESKLPSLMLKGEPYIQEYTLKNAMDCIEKNIKQFNATASYGKLHIDEGHGLFAISKEITKEGKPKIGNNVFSVYALTDIGIFCTSPRVEHNNVLVDIELRFSLEEPRFSQSVLIKKNVHCKSKRTDSKHIEWEEPSDMMMFKTLFNNMLKGAFEKVGAMLCGTTVHAFEIEKARAIFMLPEDYTFDDLKRAKKMMLKVYHPDNAGEDMTIQSQIINKSFNLLKSELESRGMN